MRGLDPPGFPDQMIERLERKFLKRVGHYAAEEKDIGREGKKSLPFMSLYRRRNEKSREFCPQEMNRGISKKEVRQAKGGG